MEGWKDGKLEQWENGILAIETHPVTSGATPPRSSEEGNLVYERSVEKNSMVGK